MISQIRILSEKTEDVKKMISFKEEANKVTRENAIDIQLELCFLKKKNIFKICSKS